MTQLLVSFQRRNIQLGNGRWVFPRSHKMRFEWFALLALRRLSTPEDQAWVSLDDIAHLPSWSGRSKHHIATNIGRYLNSTEFERSKLVIAITIWSGPYRLNASAAGIKFDVPVDEVRKRLRVREKRSPSIERARLLRFTLLFVRAHWLMFRGRLRRNAKGGDGDTAYDLLMKMVPDTKYSASLRMLACLSAADVLFRLGRFTIARQVLTQHSHLLRFLPDLSLKAQFYLRLAWAYQRVASGRASDRQVLKALSRAGAYAEQSGDRAALGLLAYRTALYRTKKKDHLEAIDQLLVALEAYLITSDYEAVHTTCGQIGSMLHRLEQPYYAEARRWLLLSIAVGRWMRVGRDDAHVEMILGKIHVELNHPDRSHWLLGRAERIAERAGNLMNLADVRMVWGFWYQRFGTKKQLINALTNALLTFRQMKEFDVRQKERYMERQFPEAWDFVLAKVANDGPQT